MKPECWFAAVEGAMVSLGAEWEADPLWGAARRWRGAEQLPAKEAASEEAVAEVPADAPAWLRQVRRRLATRS